MYDATYTNFDDIKLDGDRAFGKVAQMKMWRGGTESDHFTAHPCERGGGIAWMKMTFLSRQKDAVKSIGTRSRNCDVLRFKITGKEKYSDVLVGELLSVGR